MTTASIVVHRTSPSMLEGLLKTLARENVVHVYIVDNSPDQFLAAIVPDSPKFEYIHVENNGYGAAHNIAIRKAMLRGADYHLVLNPDIDWNGTIVDKLESIMNNRPTCGMIHPRVTYPDGSLQHTCRMLPAPIDVFGKRFLPKAVMKRRLRRYLLSDSDYDREFNAVYVQGSFMFLRLDILREIGLFDERFFMYPEDIDLTRRIRARADVLFRPDVTVVHKHEASSYKSLKMLWIHCINMVKYFNKWGWMFDSERKRLNSQLKSLLLKNQR